MAVDFVNGDCFDEMDELTRLLFGEFDDEEDEDLYVLPEL